MIIYCTMVVIALVCVIVICLRLMGRPWWCKCRQFDLWATGDDCYSQHLFDPWTVSHFGHGIFMYGCFRGVLIDHSAMLAVLATVVTEGVWEVIENTSWVIQGYRRAGDKNYFGDSVVNSLGDLLVCVAGAVLTSLFV